MEFTSGDDGKNKILLTKKSSKRLSHHTAMVRGRDEQRDVFRKVYRYRHTDEAPRDITLHCMEYTLSNPRRAALHRPTVASCSKATSIFDRYGNAVGDGL